MGRFEQILSRYPRQTAEVIDFPAPPERYVLHAGLDGYVIRDRGEVIATFHGPQFGLASRLLGMLKAEDAAAAGGEAA